MMTRPVSALAGPAAVLAVILVVHGPGGPATAATLYKWVDEQGNVTYQDRPPPEGRDYETRVIPDPPPADGGESAAASAAGTVPPGADPLTLYTIPECDSCDLVRLYLSRNGIPFVERSAGDDVDAQKELVERTGAFDVPTLLVGDRVVLGFDRDELVDALVDGGYGSLLPERESAGDGEAAAEGEAEGETAADSEATAAGDPEGGEAVD
jgi:glutaredoxin